MWIFYISSACDYTTFQVIFSMLKKEFFKSWQVCDWLAKWLIMLGFMDLRRPRVVRCSNVSLVISVGSTEQQQHIAGASPLGSCLSHPPSVVKSSCIISHPYQYQAAIHVGTLLIPKDWHCANLDCYPTSLPPAMRLVTPTFRDALLLYALTSISLPSSNLHWHNAEPIGLTLFHDAILLYPLTSLSLSGNNICWHNVEHMGLILCQIRLPSYFFTMTLR